MHSSINFFLFFFFLALFFKPRDMRPLPLSLSFLEGKLFELHSLPHGSLTFLGDSHPLQNDGIALTKVGMQTDAPRSSGMVLYSHPILFLDPRLKKVPSFSTKFAFAIENIDADGEAGDGLAFLISPDNDHLGSPGYLGLVDSTDLTRNKFIAIEFDTKCDPRFQDPDDNHLGLDINSLSSVQVATSTSFGVDGVDLKSGDVVVTWIDYKSDEKRLEVFLSYSNLKPEKPLLKVHIDLFDHVKEKMFVGFSAASERSMQSTRIEQWEFTIVEFNPPTPLSSSPPESGRTFPDSSEHKHSHPSWLAIGLTVVCFVPFVVVFGCYFWKKLMGMLPKSGGTDNLKMQTISSSGGTSCEVIRLSIPGINPDEVARGLIIDKVLDNEAELIRVKKVQPSIPLPATVCL